MSALGYSELFTRITKVKESKLDAPFAILNRNGTSKKRMKVLKKLAGIEKATIGKLLRSLKQNIGGGSYLTIRKYFEDLEKERLLKKEKVGKKVVWMFNEKYKDVKRFICLY